MKDKNKKTVFVTGGSRGIGRAIKECFAERGYDVIAPTRDEMDLSCHDSILAYFAKNNIRAEVLINNASVNEPGPINSLDIACWQKVLTTNLTSVFLLLQNITPYMIEKKWGRVVNIGSCYSLVSRAGRSAYASAKSGLNGLTRTAALEYAAHNIFVNAVCPGFVDTEMTRQNNTPKQIEKICAQIPLNRLASPEEVASFVYYVGSEQNNYITGQVLIIDGGFVCQ
ncbi:3-oxoacyl-[acyl-carrier-protein] reductase FabG [subsurface metagenome]